LRRRLHLVRKRGQLLAHIQNTNYQYNLPAITSKLAAKINRQGISDRFEDPSVRKSMDIDLELAGHLDRMIKELELFITRQAKQHDADMFHRLRSVPGIGKILALTILHEIHDISRFPCVQDFASYSRLVKCSKESGGKKLGFSGKKIGNVHLKWAFSEAAVLFLKDNPKGQKLLSCLAQKHGKGKALSILAHKLGRAVYYLMSHKRSFDMNKFLAS
jgi:transposase